MVAKQLRHQPDRDPSEGVPNEILDIRFRKSEGHDSYLAVAVAELRNIAMWSDPLRNPVDGINSHSHRALDPQVDCHDRVQITINAGEFIQARLASEGYCVVGCNGPDVVVEARVCRTKHWPTVFHTGTFP